jgi:hypothetical protein
MSDVHLRPIEPLIAIILARLCGSAPAIAALLGRFLPRLGPLVARRRPFFLCAPIVFRILWGKEQSAGSGTAKKPWARQECPRLHLFVGFRAWDIIITALPSAVISD